MLANFHMCGIMLLLLRAAFKMLVRAYVFWCLMFSLSGPCELLFPLDLSCGECKVIPLYFLYCSVNGSVCLVCCVSDSICELIGETIRNIFGCVGQFVVECYGNVECG